MKTKIKSAMLLFSVMVIGIVMGMLISFRIINYKIDHAYKNFTENRLLMNMIEESAHPDKKQAEEIRKILDEYRPKFAALLYSSRVEARKLIDSLIKDLEKVLTEEQLNKLKNNRFFRRKERNTM
jgi:biopolymer transport protein ExbB/TolQ